MTNPLATPQTNGSGQTTSGFGYINNGTTVVLIECVIDAIHEVRTPIQSGWVPLVGRIVQAVAERAVIIRSGIAGEQLGHSGVNADALGIIDGEGIAGDAIGVARTQLGIAAANCNTKIFASPTQSASNTPRSG